MKKIIFILVLFLFPSVILANEINNIDMNIYVDNYGTAHVTEVWDTHLTNGTEGYKPYYNLGSSNITNFKVSMDGEEYTFNENYNINGSFNDKKYQNGFNYIENGIELCFGISKYGSNTYTLTYDISNFVVKTKDEYQMIYWTLFPYDYNPSPNRVYIKIYSDFKYSSALDVWGFGKGGVPTYVYDGYIEMDSESTVAKNEYMTILVKYPKDTFTLSTTVDKTFSEYLDIALDGSRAYSEVDNNYMYFIGWFLLILIIILLIPCLFTIPTHIKRLKIYLSYGRGYKDNKKIIKRKVMSYRDIPCNKDIYYANALVSLNSDIFKKYKSTNIFGAIILKWIKEDKIVFKDVKKGLFNNNAATIELTLKDVKFDNKLEQKLFIMMYRASNDGILETKELAKWCKKNYFDFLNIFGRMKNDEIDKLKEEGHIYKRKDKKECKKKDVMDDTIYEESIKLVGLKKFLDEFSRIGAKEVLDVKLWDEYLMFAYIFGDAKRVAKQLKDLYPEVLQEMNIDYSTLIGINYISNSSIRATSSSMSKTQSYSSGGGGFSSSGGGGGSFGGGGGGGGFR